MINTNILNRVLISWGDDIPPKEEGIINTIDIKSQLSEGTIIAKYQQGFIWKGIKLINARTLFNLNSKLYVNCGKHILDIVDIYIGNTKLLKDQVSLMGLITDNIDEPMQEAVKIIFKGGIPVNLSALFSNCVNLVKIEKFLDLDLIKEQNPSEKSVNMFNIFYNCHSLYDICSIDGLEYKEAIQIYKSIPAIELMNKSCGFINQYNELKGTL